MQFSFLNILACGDDEDGDDYDKEDEGLDVDNGMMRMSLRTMFDFFLLVYCTGADDDEDDRDEEYTGNENGDEDDEKEDEEEGDDNGVQAKCVPRSNRVEVSNETKFSYICNVPSA